MNSVFKGLLLWLIACGTAFSQAYDTRKPITLLVGFPAGSASDNLARILAKEMTELLKNPVIIENRPGATGNIAAEVAAKAAPDGYTILFATNTHATAPSLYRKLSFDPIRDFAPVSLVATSPAILLADPSLPVASVSELVRLAKTKPGQLNYGSAGNGSAPHLTMELLKASAGIDVVHVPYKGVPAALNDLMGGRIPVMFSTISPSIPLMKAGKVKALAVTSAKRFPLVPEVPAMSETIPGFEVLAWWGVLVPAKTPSGTVTELHDAIAKIVRTPDVRAKLVSLGYDLVGGTPAEFGSFIESETVKWTLVVKNSGAQLD